MDPDIHESLEKLHHLMQLRDRAALEQRAERLLPGDEEVIAECEGSLLAFTRHAWHILEPKSRLFKEGWAIEAICDHLEAVTNGDIQNLLINVPPGVLKSLSTKVFWPAWEWGPKNMAYLRYVTASYSKHLSDRDALKLKRLVTSDWYQRLWPHVILSSDQKAKTYFHTTQTGFMLAASVGGLGTGERGDRLIDDDPNNVRQSESAAVRESTNRWRAETWPSRTNDPMVSAFIDIQQRTHENDVTGYLLSNPPRGLVHLCLPMEYEPKTHCATKIGFSDPRTREGELLFQERFPKEVVEDLKKSIGPYATAAQLQQVPVPRGGQIIGYDDWQIWDDKNAQKLGFKASEYPPMELIIACFDGAYTEEDENDYTGLTIWGLWRHPITRQPQVMLMYAWRDRLQLNPVVLKVGTLCTKFRVDKLLIENKATGHSVNQELKRLFGSTVSTVLVNISGGRGKFSPLIHRGDKVARAYSVQHIWTNGQVWRPQKQWAELVAGELAALPKGHHDDLADPAIMGIRWLRDSGFLLVAAEGTGEVEIFGKQLEQSAQPLYDV